MSKLVLGNWKMHPGIRESLALARGVLLGIRGKEALPEIVLFPPFLALPEVHKLLARSRVGLGAQDLFWEEVGAFTGEVSSRILLEVGCRHVLVGHSERREHLGETDAMVRRKVEAAWRAKLVPVVCVGESATERESGGAEAAVEARLRAVLGGLAFPPSARLVVAYEPLWAVGSGTPALPEQAAERHALIRTLLVRDFGFPVAAVRVAYGGSVMGENAYAFLREPEVDGVLVGGASLKLAQFLEIIQAASDVLGSRNP
ncbi:triose-phosphate isomerase [Candidatus Uhrbacteria bacterium]|nr:triose-phosphate isomerase [Candidatus Uhrbacteria bacterium]